MPLLELYSGLPEIVHKLPVAFPACVWTFFPPVGPLRCACACLSLHFRNYWIPFHYSLLPSSDHQNRYPAVLGLPVASPNPYSDSLVCRAHWHHQVGPYGWPQGGAGAQPPFPAVVPQGASQFRPGAVHGDRPTPARDQNQKQRLTPKIDAGRVH